MGLIKGAKADRDRRSHWPMISKSNTPNEFVLKSPLPGRIAGASVVKTNS